MYTSSSTMYTVRLVLTYETLRWKLYLAYTPARDTGGPTLLGGQMFTHMLMRIVLFPSISTRLTTTLLIAAQQCSWRLPVGSDQYLTIPAVIVIDSCESMYNGMEYHQV